jgi:hypothetical protein
MTTKTKVIIGTVALASSFALGRYTVPEKKTEEKKSVVSKQKRKRRNTDKKVQIIKKETIKPDGTKTTETVINKDSKTSTVTDEKGKKEDTSKVAIIRGDSKVTISMLNGLDINSWKYVYGASLIKPILGPLTLGIFGLSNGTFGGSLGLTF